MRQTVTPLFLLGVVALFIGGAIMGANWPHSEPNVFYGVLDGEPMMTEEGSWGGVLVGSLIALVGQVSLGIAVIAVGVHLGVKVALQNRAVTPIQ